MDHLTDTRMVGKVLQNYEQTFGISTRHKDTHQLSERVFRSSLPVRASDKRYHKPGFGYEVVERTNRLPGDKKMSTHIGLLAENASMSKCSW